MKIETTPTRGSRVLRYALVGSLIFHVVLVVAFTAFGKQSPVRSYVVNLVVTEPSTPPPPPPKKEPPKPPTNLPPPNQQNKPVPPTAEPPKPVFGVTQDSVTEGDSGVNVRVGNTLMQEPERELTDPNAVRPYSGPPEPPSVVDADELDAPPKLLDMVQPDYPILAKRANREGFVRLRFLVGSGGRVSTVKVLVANPPGMGFEDAAVAAVKQWRFDVPRMNGRPVGAWIVQTIRFKME